MEEDKGLARSTDPGTSHIAASEVNVGRGRKKLLIALKHGSKTGWEVGKFWNEPMTTLMPRAPKLRREGFIKEVDRVRASNGGNRETWQIVWSITEDGLRYLSNLEQQK